MRAALLRDERGAALAHRLSLWCEDGSFANLFDGPSQIDLAAPVLVFDLKRVVHDQRDADLARVIFNSIVGAVSSLALNRTREPKFLIFDEAGLMLKDEATAEFMEYCFRTLRKTGVCVGAISQGLEDFLAHPRARNAFVGAADNLFVLKQDNYDKARVVAREKNLSEVELRRIQAVGHGARQPRGVPPDPNDAAGPAHPPPAQRLDAAQVRLHRELPRGPARPPGLPGSRPHPPGGRAAIRPRASPRDRLLAAAAAAVAPRPMRTFLLAALRRPSRRLRAPAGPEPRRRRGGPPGGAPAAPAAPLGRAGRREPGGARGRRPGPGRPRRGRPLVSSRRLQRAPLCAAHGAGFQPRRAGALIAAMTVCPFRRWLLAGLLLAGPARSRALFGVGDIVFDPANTAQTINVLRQAQQQFDRLGSLLGVSTRQFDQLVQLAAAVGNSAESAGFGGVLSAAQLQALVQAVPGLAGVDLGALLNPNGQLDAFLGVPLPQWLQAVEHPTAFYRDLLVAPALARLGEAAGWSQPTQAYVQWYAAQSAEDQRNLGPRAASDFAQPPEPGLAGRRADPPRQPPGPGGLRPGPGGGDARGHPGRPAARASAAERPHQPDPARGGRAERRRPGGGGARQRSPEPAPGGPVGRPPGFGRDGPRCPAVSHGPGDQRRHRRHHAFGRHRRRAGAAGPGPGGGARLRDGQLRPVRRRLPASSGGPLLTLLGFNPFALVATGAFHALYWAVVVLFLGVMTLIAMQHVLVGRYTIRGRHPLAIRTSRSR